MTRPLVFISHAGSDTARSVRVASLLEAAGIPTILDRRDLALASDFVGFIDQALSRSDYCLLLWSRAAAGRDAVLAEYHAAFGRELRQRRVFLLVGRLEDHPPPPLLTTRMYVDLFPGLERGVDELVEFWNRDRVAAARGRKPVVPVPPDARPEKQTLSAPPSDSMDVLMNNIDRCELYVTSELFDCTLPFVANLDRPVGLLLGEVRARLDLPLEVPIRSGLGVRLSCTLLNGDERLDKARSLRAHGVSAGAVLTLELTLEPMASPASGCAQAGRQVFRTDAGASDALINILVEKGLRAGA